MVTTAQVVLAAADLQSAEEHMLELLRQATIGEYDVMGELGRGGMATVYLAHDIALDRKVAIKIMNPQILLGAGMTDRFKREARTAGSLSHPNIIPIYLVREAGQILFFVMKYVEGRSLDSIIREQGALPVKMAQAILVQVGGALGYAHRRGVVHRDIKPANIMIDDEGWAVVTDFGIAKVAEASGLTQSGATVGTPVYMSPEQASARDIAGASDQYSLGVVAYEMLTGRPPFGGDSLLAVMRGHLFDPLPPLAAARPDCPPALAAAVSRMLEKEPSNRWATLEDAVKAIGTAPLAMDDPIRTQMIELARSGAKVRRISMPATPRSPVPVGSARPESAPARRRRSRWGRPSLAAALVIVIGVAIATRPWATDRSGDLPSGPTADSIAAVHRRDSLAAVRRRDSIVAATNKIRDSMSRAAVRVVTQPPRKSPVPTPTPATTAAGEIKLGTRGLAAVFSIDGEPLGAIGSLKSWSTSPGTHRLAISEAGCKDWDTTVVVTPGTTLPIGYRSPTCPTH